MNKLFLIFFLFTLHLNGMNSSQRVITGIVAGMAGVGGAHLANKTFMIGTNAIWYSEDRASYLKAKNTCLLMGAASGSIRFGSLLIAALLGRYAYANRLPSCNMQTGAGALAIIVSGGLCGLARGKGYINRRELFKDHTYQNRIALSGIMIGALGTYVLYTNS